MLPLPQLEALYLQHVQTTLHYGLPALTTTEHAALAVWSNGVQTLLRYTQYGHDTVFPSSVQTESSPSCTPCTPMSWGKWINILILNLYCTGLSQILFCLLPPCSDIRWIPSLCIIYLSNSSPIEPTTACFTESTRNNKGIMAISVVTNACRLSEKVFIKVLYSSK